MSLRHARFVTRTPDVPQPSHGGVRAVLACGGPAAWRSGLNVAGGPESPRHRNDPAFRKRRPRGDGESGSRRVTGPLRGPSDAVFHPGSISEGSGARKRPPGTDNDENPKSTILLERRSFKAERSPQVIGSQRKGSIIRLLMRVILLGVRVSEGIAKEKNTF